MQAIRESDDPPLSAPPTYAGWYRAKRAEQWRRLVEGDTYDEAWGRLLDELASLSQRGGESTVLPHGSNPNHGASTRLSQRAGR